MRLPAGNRAVCCQVLGSVPSTTIPPGLRTRLTSRSAARGSGRWCSIATIMAPSNVSAANGRRCASVRRCAERSEKPDSEWSRRASPSCPGAMSVSTSR